jgi:hypothetical protein
VRGEIYKNWERLCGVAVIRLACARKIRVRATRVRTEGRGLKRLDEAKGAAKYGTHFLGRVPPQAFTYTARRCIVIVAVISAHLLAACGWLFLKAFTL